MTEEIKEGYRNKLKNKLFGLLCEYEKDGEKRTSTDIIINVFEFLTTKKEKDDSKQEERTATIFPEKEPSQDELPF